MICPECKKQGLKSKVFREGTVTNAMGTSQYYDEEGEFHNHDPNLTTAYYQCSNKHYWKKETYSNCWCGWRGAIRS